MIIKVFFLSSLSLISSSFAMCEYPHNPPVVCLEGSIIKSTKVVSKNYKCILTVRVEKLIRPSGTYLFNSNLDRIDFKEDKMISLKEVKMYSNRGCELKRVKTVAEYNCNDRNGDIPDMSLLDGGSVKMKVRDPWTEKSPLIDCLSHLSM